jgi:hypothetical protein
MFLQQRGITYQTARCHSTCFTHDHTHHSYQQLICIVSVRPLFAVPLVTATPRCAPVSNQPCASFPTHYSQHLHNWVLHVKVAYGRRVPRVQSGETRSVRLGCCRTGFCHRNSGSQSRRGPAEMCRVVVGRLQHVAILPSCSG